MTSANRPAPSPLQASQLNHLIRRDRDVSMCGIAGFIVTSQRGDLERRLKSMARSIRHRGPDGEGFYLDRARNGSCTIGLAHRRLAIIDLATGEQPMVHQSAGVTLIYNGEIYNFDLLKRELEAIGHRFRTKSDTEVLLNAYVEWGPDCVRRLRGMFAFALWDHPRGRLMLARDHFGKKPLYIHEANGRLLFGSEIKALLAFGDMRPKLDRASIADYLVYRYVPAPHTFFAGVRKLLPGSYALWEGGELTERSFYTPPYGLTPDDDTPNGEALGLFAEALDTSVRIRMVSDVPYGAFLSGGIDSSTIVALMSRHSALPVNTFSVGFREARYSELPYARLVARRFSTRHTELVVSAEDLMQHLPTLIDHSDAPVAEASNIPIYLISREAAKSVKMVLTGEGADELLGGYPKHSAERFTSIYQAIMPACLHRAAIEPVINRLPYSFRRIKVMMASIGIRDSSERLPRWLGALSFAERDRLMGGAPFRTPHARPFQASDRRSPLQRMLYFDQTSWLPDNLLERGDRITMAASIEARMPFMDTELAALTAHLPDSWRIKGFTQKYILRRMMREVLPAEILGRAKVGFRVPINEWFRGPMRNFVRDHVMGRGSLAGQLFSRREVERVLWQHENGRQNHEKLIWTLVNLELFQKQFHLG
jgi:asparagine synthase (glutamine-hydrolysing)